MSIVQRTLFMGATAFVLLTGMHLHADADQSNTIGCTCEGNTNSWDYGLVAHWDDDDDPPPVSDDDPTDPNDDGDDNDEFHA